MPEQSYENFNYCLDSIINEYITVIPLDRSHVFSHPSHALVSGQDRVGQFGVILMHAKQTTLPTMVLSFEVSTESTLIQAFGLIRSCRENGNDNACVQFGSDPRVGVDAFGISNLRRLCSLKGT